VRAVLRLRVHPGARRAGLVGWMADGTLKLSVKEAPEDGRANRALVAWLALALGVRESAIRVVRGQSGRSKVVEVDGMDEATLRARITAGMEPAPGEGASRGKGPRKGGGTNDGR